MKFKLSAFAVVFLILVVAYVFGGCGRNTTDNQSQDGTTTQEVQPQ